MLDHSGAGLAKGKLNTLSCWSVFFHQERIYFLKIRLWRTMNFLGFAAAGITSLSKVSVKLLKRAMTDIELSEDQKTCRKCCFHLRMICCIWWTRWLETGLPLAENLFTVWNVSKAGFVSSMGIAKKFLNVCNREGVPHAR